MPTLLDNSTHKALTTLARAKIFLDISGDSKDGLITMLINQATGFIESYCKRNFLQQTYTDEVYDGTGGDTLVLKQNPVASVTRLQVNTSGDSSPAWQTIDSNNYFVDASGLVRLNNPVAGFLDQDAGSFLPDPQKYRVTYAAGYLIDFANENDPTKHTLPQDLEYACQLLVSGKMNTRKSGGLTAARVGDISMTFRDLAQGDPEVKAILERYAEATI